jgi:thiol-disulfide isomerase/thioredoxin
LIPGTLFFQACTTTPEKQESFQLKEGSWNLHFSRNETSIPVRLNISANTVQIINAEETIETSISYKDSGKFEIPLPVFGTVLSGKITSDSSFSAFWVPPGRADSLGIAGQATFRSIDKFQQYKMSRDTLMYEVKFSPQTDDEYPAVGLFRKSDGMICGTFLTETGDYRYLQGETRDDSFTLSCFDGAHLFGFEGTFIEEDSIAGVFYSGKTWSEPWQGKFNKNASLAHPDSITQFIDKTDKSLLFSALDKTGAAVEFNQNTWLNKVSIVQIFGSWCPNCMDESRFYAELHQKFGANGLQIIPVAFERHSQLQAQVSALEKFESATNLPVESYIGGPASKPEASKVFSQLSGISSFPTTIIIDKKGKVRKVHTGFYGPGTGKYYERYTASMHAFIESLINE